MIASLWSRRSLLPIKGFFVLAYVCCINALWTPIELHAQDDPIDPTIVSCDLLVGFQQYAAAPYDYPKFRDIVTASKCNQKNQRKQKLSALLQEAPTIVVAPTAFLFHESRVGSTLVSNMLAANSRSLVFSESKPPVDALFHCPKCSTDQERGELFRSVVHLMGSSATTHDYLFFKFQSIVSQKMSIILSVFPDVPWVFIYRSPVQTLMSHLDPSKSGNHKPPCLKSKKRPTEQVEMSEAVDAPREAWCAWHLNMLCQHALRAYHTFSVYNTTIPATRTRTRTSTSTSTSTRTRTRTSASASGAAHPVPSRRQRGFLVNYASLPGAVGAQLLPAFGVAPVGAEWRGRMEVVSKQYSKARGAEKGKGEGEVDGGGGRGAGASSGSRLFASDSQDKDERAPAAMKRFATMIMQPTFVFMEMISERGWRQWREEQTAPTDSLRSARGAGG